MSLKPRDTLRSAFSPLINALQAIAHWRGIEALLSWDQETVMPSGAIESRAEQSALVATYAHQQLASDRFRGLLGEWVALETGKPYPQDLNALESAFLREVYRDWQLATALPATFVETFTKAKARSQHAWIEARKKDAFSDFAPHLESIVALTTQRADYLSQGRGTYETLLDEYEPGMTLAMLNPVLDDLKSETLRLMAKIRRQPERPIFPLHEKEWDVQKQWEFSRMVLQDMGFSSEHGRLDASAHPFSTHIHPTDVRITTRVRSHDFLEGLSSTMHECGHALYEQGLDTTYFGTPLCAAGSFGLHESQSRFWENGIGKHRAFWEYYFPKLCALFPEVIRESDFESFLAAQNQVKPSLIRVQADELTYNLHIVIRYELETALFSGALSVKDLPGAWREKYQSYLGVSSPTDADGVMQDVHWSCGYFGYFPTYSLGNLYAAMLLDRIGQDLDLAAQLRKGQLLPIREWLRTHIHSVGRQLSTQTLIHQLTGSSLSSESFVHYLESRHLS